MTSFNHVAAEADGNCKDGTEAGMAPNIVNQTETTAELSRDKSSQNEIDKRCGCGPCHPKCLQVCAIPSSFLFFMCCLVFTQSCLVSGFSSSILTTIEKRYNLRGSELGFIISSYDITAVIAGIIVSYFGDAHNRARWLSRGALLIALGSTAFSLPHFIGGNYEVPNFENITNGGISLCNITNKGGSIADDCMNEAERLKNPETWALGVFMVSFMLIGIGASPVYTLGTTYLYDNVKTGRYPVYSGIMYSMGALGPAAGFLVGASLLQIYVHPGEDPAGLTSSSPRWIGAWWMGFLIIAVMALTISIPLTFFPKELPGLHHGGDEERPTFANFGSRIKDFPRYLRKLLRNMSWLTVTLVIVVEQSIGTGFNRFIAKYIELAFNLPPTTANILTGCVLIPAAVLGIISGGVVMNKLTPSLSGTAKLLLMLNCIPTIALATLFALGCDSVNIVGVTDAYPLLSTERPELVEQFSIEYKKNLTADCNAGCQCKATMYSPVCGSNQRTYYSPCHAGCTKLDIYLNPDGTQVKNYSSCACIYDEFIHTQPVANSGRCDGGCQSLIPFLSILFFVVYMTTCGQNPALILTLRSVSPNSRSFALGIQNFFSQLLAFIPAPIYFGQIFDSQCILWTPKCDGVGACLEYDTHRLPYTLFGTCLALKILTFFFLILLLIATKYREKRKEAYDLNESVVTSDSTLTSDSRTTSVSTISVTFPSRSNSAPGDSYSLSQNSFTAYDPTTLTRGATP